MNSMPFIDLAAQQARIGEKIRARIDAVLNTAEALIPKLLTS